MRIITIIVVLLAIQAWQSSSASSAWKDSTHLLPQYCKDRAIASSNPDVMKKLKKTYGGVAIHLHHYCSGIYSEMQAKTSRDNREHHLYKVVTQMEYVGKSCQVKCIFYPELHTRWAWALGKQGKFGEAIKHYQLAYQAKPNYIPAYTKLSRLYLKADQTDEARKILELGLKANPNSKSLKKRLKKIEPSS